jgi:hypothetical protein
MLLDRKDEWLAVRPEDLDYGDTGGIEAAPSATTLPHVRPLIPLPRPVRRHRRRRSRLQIRHRPKAQAVWHAWTVNDADSIITLRCAQARPGWRRRFRRLPCFVREGGP